MNDNHKQALACLLGGFVAQGMQLSDMAIVGGYARDLAHGAEPKDIDVVVVNCIATGLLVNNVGAGWKLEHVYSDDADYTGEGVDYDRRLKAVLKFKHIYDDVLPVDVLVPLPEFDTVYGFVQKFDYNLNQYVIPGSQVVLGSPGPLFIGKNEGELQQLRDSQVTEERAQRMRAKAEAFGWLVPQEDI